MEYAVINTDNVRILAVITKIHLKQWVMGHAMEKGLRNYASFKVLGAFHFEHLTQNFWVQFLVQQLLSHAFKNWLKIFLTFSHSCCFLFFWSLVVINSSYIDSLSLTLIFSLYFLIQSFTSPSIAFFSQQFCLHSSNQ